MQRVWLKTMARTKNIRHNRNKIHISLSTAIMIGIEQLHYYHSCFPFKKRLNSDCIKLSTDVCVCILSCQTKVLCLEAGKDINNTDSYILKNVNECEMTHPIIHEEIEWEMGGMYEGYFCSAEILFWLPDKSQAFIYLTFRDPSKMDSHVWTKKECIHPKRCRRSTSTSTLWKLNDMVQIRVYDDADRWLWRKAVIQDILNHGFYNVQFYQTKLTKKVHTSLIRN